MHKLVMVGTGEFGPVFVTIEYSKGRLSLHGVEGPLHNGNARGGAGQITLDAYKIGVPNAAEGWDEVRIERLAAIWRLWHLNDMRPGCEHQQSWNVSEPLEVVEYSLTSAAMKEQRDAKAAVVSAAVERGTITVGQHVRDLLTLPTFIKGRAPNADGPESGRYEVYKRETRPAGHVTRDEHPKGLLGKSCEVHTCTHRYGSAWLREEVPAATLEWLESLPETEVTYPAAWRR